MSWFDSYYIYILILDNVFNEFLNYIFLREVFRNIILIIVDMYVLFCCDYCDYVVWENNIIREFMIILFFFEVIVRWMMFVWWDFVFIFFLNFWLIIWCFMIIKWLIKGIKIYIVFILLFLNNRLLKVVDKLWCYNV